MHLLGAVNTDMSLYCVSICLLSLLLSLPVQQVAKESQELMARALEEVSCQPLGSLTAACSLESPD